MRAMYVGDRHTGPAKFRRLRGGDFTARLKLSRRARTVPFSRETEYRNVTFSDTPVFRYQYGCHCRY